MTVDVPEEVARIEAQLLAPGGPFEIEQVVVDGETMSAFKSRPHTLYDLLMKSANFGDAVYVLATDGVRERAITYAQHLELVEDHAMNALRWRPMMLKPPFPSVRSRQED